MSLKDNLEQRRGNEVRQRQKALDDVRECCRGPVNKVVGKLPGVVEAFGEFDSVVAGFSGRDWITIRQLSKPIDDAVKAVDAARINVHIVRGAIRELSELTADRCYGSRPDGQRDPNVAVGLRMDLQDKLAHALCADSIRRNVEVIKSALKVLEDRFAWQAHVGGKPVAAQPGSVIVVPPAKSQVEQDPPAWDARA